MEIEAGKLNLGDIIRCEHKDGALYFSIDTYGKSYNCVAKIIKISSRMTARCLHGDQSWMEKHWQVMFLDEDEAELAKLSF